MKLTSLMTKQRSSSTGNDERANDPQPPLRLENEFRYEKGSCALEYWEPVRLLGEGSISDIHLVRRRSKRIHVRYKKKRDVMKFAKQRAQQPTEDKKDETDVFVLKSIMKDHVDNDLVLEEMRRELYTMSKLEHPNIVKLYEAYERRRHIYLIMDYCSGGDLTDRHFSEEETAWVVSKILSAVAYMHSKGVVHRDLKLENIMMDGDGEIKIIDFGLATKYLSEEHKVMTDRVGTLYTMAPQVLQGVYTSKCDMWSIGVVTFMLLSSGINPFWGPPRPMPWSQRRRVMIDRVMRCHYQRMTGPSWEKISPAAKAFCASLLQMDPDDRPTAQGALVSDWIRSISVEEQRNVASQEEQECRRALLQLKRAAIQVLAQDMTEDQVICLRSELERYDQDGDGRIRIEDFRKALEDHTNSSKARIVTMFDEHAVDLSAHLAYNDFCIRVLADRDRTITEKTAEALDGLDGEGSRKVKKDRIRAALEGILSPEVLDELLQQVSADTDGQVSTVEMLELLDKSMANHMRSSLRSQADDEEHNDDFIDETNAVIPGGRTDSPRKPKYVYESKRKSMRKVED